MSPMFVVVSGLEVDTLVGDLESVGVSLWEDDGRLRFRAPRGVMTGERTALLRAHRDAVLAYLRGADGTPVLEPRPGERHDPFPLTDVQAAYLLGRREVSPTAGSAVTGTANWLTKHSTRPAWNGRSRRWLRGTRCCAPW